MLECHRVVYKPTDVPQSSSGISRCSRPLRHCSFKRDSYLPSRSYKKKSVVSYVLQLCDKYRKISRSHQICNFKQYFIKNNLCTKLYSKKGKIVPLQAWSGTEGSRKLRFPDFVTTAQDGGRLSALHTGRLYPQEMLLVLISVRR